MTGPTGSLSRLRVLIAEDNANMRRLLSAVLRGFGVREIAEAGDVAEATNILNTSQVDLLITDYLMTPETGVDLVRKVRDLHESRNPYLPIIMLSGAADRDVVARARDAGVTEMMAKPISAAEMWRRIEAVIERPRPFVRTKVFFGPDRRRRRGEYHGPERRDAAAASS